MKTTTAKLMLASASISAFANAAAATKPKNDTPPAPPAGDANTGTADKPADGTTQPAANGDAKPKGPTIAAIRTDIPIPSKTNSLRGVKSPYEFEKLPMGGSRGVMDKTVKQLSSVVSNFNRRPDNREIVKNEDGSTVFEMQEIKAPDGTITKVPTSVAVTRPKIEIVAVAVDPATDPDKAPVRIFRIR